MKQNKILIAEDEVYVSRVLKLVLKQEGYQVTCVNNGKLALESYLSEPPDILITDVKMPHMTGRELVEEIRYKHRDADTPIIVMTSTLESENRDWVGGISHITFLGKPVGPRDLVRVVNDYFDLSKVS